MVRFATDLDPRRLPGTLSAFTGIVPWHLWQRRVENLRSELGRNPHWENYLSERHGLELALADIRSRSRATGRWPWPPRTPDEYRVASFLAMALRVHASLGDRAKPRLCGAIRSALEREAGLGPIAFELRVVAHLMSRGFDISFNDLENGGGFDFLARRDASEIEVECKHVSADIGRQIHRRKVYDLGGLIHRSLLNAVDRSQVGRLLRVKLPGRLTGNKDHQNAIAKQIEIALDDPHQVDPAICDIVVQEFAIHGSAFDRNRGGRLTLQEVGAYVYAEFGLDQAHMLLNWRPGHSAIVVHFESVERDRVLEEIFKRLKADAKRQFSGNRPAFMCVHLADVTHEQLMELARADHSGSVTGVRQAISTLLHKRGHLHGVAIMVDGEIRLARRGRGNLSVQENGPSYVFINPDHPEANNPSLQQMFG